MRTLAVIPARHRSTRLPGKPLAEIAGRTMVEHVYRRTEQAELIDQVMVATDDTRIRDAVAAFGGRSVMTSQDHPSGTDRVAEVAADADADIIVNVQGDEPLIDPNAIDLAVAACQSGGGSVIASLRRAVSSAKELWDPNAVKVVCDRKGQALYFSRWPIPFHAASNMNITTLREQIGDELLPSKGMFYVHIGLYVYPKNLLLELSRAEPSPLECLERLEQLRALENGIPIRMVLTSYEAMSVDTPEDLEQVRTILEERDARA